LDIEFDYKGDPLGGTITNCKYTDIFCTAILINKMNNETHCKE